MPQPNDEDDDNQGGPARKRQRIVTLNGAPPPLLHAPNIIQPTYSMHNPHTQGLGVPQIDQVYNPFEHPQPVCFGVSLFVFVYPCTISQSLQFV